MIQLVKLCIYIKCALSFFCTLWVNKSDLKKKVNCQRSVDLWFEFLIRLCILWLEDAVGTLFHINQCGRMWSSRSWWNMYHKQFINYSAETFTGDFWCTFLYNFAHNCHSAVCCHWRELCKRVSCYLINIIPREVLYKIHFLIHVRTWFKLLNLWAVCDIRSVIRCQETSFSTHNRKWR